MKYSKADKRAMWVAMLLLTLIPVSAWLSTPAKADQVDVYITWKQAGICGWFQTHPQVSAVQPMFAAIKSDTGFSGADTARVLVDSVAVFCPQYMPLLSAYANSEPAPPAPITSGIGGVWRA